MSDTVKIVATSTFMRIILPPILGAVGAILATAAPAFHAALCAAPLLVL